MSTPGEFSFGDSSVAVAYADVLVPILFEPWARALVETDLAWQGSRVLDLATGTGIVAQRLAARVGAAGSVVGMDMNQEMLDAAMARAGSQPNLSFALCSAEAIDAPDDSFDFVVCQQGFQFFSDKHRSAEQIRRVLRENGTAIVSVWRPVAECDFFGAICRSLEAIGEHEISAAMRVPFDFLPTDELVAPFESAGFSAVTVRREQRALNITGGVEHAVQAAYSTPIGPSLRALAPASQARFTELLGSEVVRFDGDEQTMGQMAADVLVATK